MLLCAGACAVATLANPYGWGVYEYVLQTTGRAAGRGIDEWLPPGLTTLTGKVWALSLVALVVLLGRSDRRPTVRELCCLAFLLPLACGSVRMVAWWLLAATPVLAAQAAGAWPRLREAPGDDRPGVGAAVACAALAAAMVLSAPALEAYSPVRLLPGRDRRTEDDLQAVADYLAAGGRGGRLFTRFAWAEYLGWALAPRWTVFMDGRIEIIPDHVWADYSALTRGRADWQELLDRYGVDGLVLDAHSGYDAGLLAQVRRSPRWRPVLEVGDAAVFERVTGHSEPGD
jgi:hypothetical protein